MKKLERPPNLDSWGHVTMGEILKGLRSAGIDVHSFKEKLSEINKDYPYWDTFKYRTKSWGVDPEVLWVLSRDPDSGININISKNPHFDFKYNLLGRVLRSLHRFDMQMGGLLVGESTIPEDDKNRYLISSIMEEAIASSQLEGAVTTREIAKEMLRSNKKPTSLSEKMILNNYITIKRVLELKGQRITKDLILEIQGLMTKDTLTNPINEGKFRESNDVNVVDAVTGEIFYTPPDFRNLGQLMDDFCTFANEEDDDAFIHPIIKGIILHFLIGYIHPFVDGNGRTARAIFYWYLISKGYWLVEYMSISRIIVRAPSQYAKAYLYTEYDDNDLTYFIDYNIKALDEALKSLQKYIQLKIKEKKDLLNSFKNENINERQAEILKSVLVDHLKSLTIQEIQNKFAVVYQTARTDLLGLVALGYLTEKKMGKKLVFFRADDLEAKLGRR